MGLRTAAPVQTTQASNQADQGDFDSAFSSLLSEDDGAPGTPPATPGAENEEEVIKAPEHDSEIETVEANAKAAREKWKMQKENKDLKARLAELEGKAKKGNIVDSDNPLRDIRQLKGWTKEDIVSKALEAMEDDGLSSAEAEKKVDAMSYEEIVAKVKADLEKDAEEKNKVSKTEETIKNFKSKIVQYAKDNAEKFPLIDGLGGSEGVYSTIEQDYIKKEEEMGTEYAQKNMMTVEQASKIVNEKLASSVKNALQSKYVRSFILNAIKEDGGKGGKETQLEDFLQLEDEEPRTLTNSVHKKVTDPKDSKELTDDERFEQSFAYLDN
jgi:hypothetical protein